jgi:hypothetical protein
MVHYAAAMRMLGPLNNMSSIRLEGKHKPHKGYSRIIHCRKNLAMSLAIKEQINRSNRFFFVKNHLIGMTRFLDQL